MEDIEEELEIMNWMDRNGVSRRADRQYRDFIRQNERDNRPALWGYIVLGLALIALGIAPSFMH